MKHSYVRISSAHVHDSNFLILVSLDHLVTIGHLDQFLFHSTLHSLSIAVSDPPLVGWAEVTHTLTGTGSGNRRRGGGRFEQLPQVTSLEVKWVRRNLI